ncbi:MAG: peptidoglycan editing factor PgeF [Peptococcaceae bacterium]|nr:peptidoglycan editing factor PgeF [Peptococcaceae bacterium]
MYQLKTNNGMVWVSADALAAQEGLVHAFSTRHGGKSTFPYASLNLGLHTGDNISTVRDNRDRFLREFGISPGEAVSLHFIHSNHVLPVSERDGGKGYHTGDDALGNADGMITNIPRRALVITYADCIPILFYDPAHRAIGACHAGWRGTAAGIAMETVKTMQRIYGTNPADLLAAVGPGIDPDHFEVGQDVYDAVSVHTPNPARLFRDKGGGKYLFDIWQANIDQLTTTGVPRAQITLIDLSTYSRDDLFFSHRRRLGGNVGRQAAFIMLS